MQVFSISDTYILIKIPFPKTIRMINFGNGNIRRMVSCEFVDDSPLSPL